MEILAGPAPSAAPLVYEPARLFRRTGFWTAPLPDPCPRHPQSRVWADNLCSQMDLDPATPDTQKTPNTIVGAAAGHAWFNVGTGGAPVIVVAADQPRVKVANGFVLDGGAWGRVIDQHNLFMTEGIPIPPDALVDASSDKSLVIYQPATESVWELYYASHTPGSYDGARTPGTVAGTYEWRAQGGGLIEHPALHNGTYQERPPREHYLDGHTATSLPLYGGIITPEEWAAALNGAPIEHTLHMVVARAQHAFVGPAHRDDGTYTDPNMIVEGARVYFPASFTWEHLDLGTKRGRGTYALGRAIQTYGALITDKTGGGCALRFLNPVNRKDGAGYDFADEAGNRIWPQQYLWSLPWHLAEVADPAVSGDF